MIHLGIIDTSRISHQFVTITLETGAYDLTAVYSRKLAAAQEPGPHYGDVEYAIDLETFFGIAHMDTVYIASPNLLHFEQAKQAILTKKNVIVKRPAFSTPDEMAETIELANKNRMYFFEAARNIHEQSFQKIAELLPLKGQILDVNFTYMKYPSRYDQVLEGKEPDIFSPHLSGGALADLGVYLVYAALGWFGVPKESHYFANKVATGIDGLGTTILRYDQSSVALNTGKINDSFAPSGTYFENGALVLDSVNAISSAKYHDRAYEGRNVLDVQVADNPTVEEARNFVAVLDNPTDKYWNIKYEEWVELARSANKIVTDLHHSTGIIFDVDK